MIKIFKFDSGTEEDQKIKTSVILWNSRTEEDQKIKPAWFCETAGETGEAKGKKNSVIPYLLQF